MNNKIKILVIGLIVLCLAYPGFAWLIGMQVEATMLKREQQALSMYPASVSLTSRQYHRGLYGATEDLTYSFGTQAMRALAPLGMVGNAAGMQMKVHNTIHHGPLPQFRTLALATFTTDVELPPQLSTTIRALLGGAPTFQIQSRLGWFGGVTTTISSPGYTAKLADGSEFTWRAFEGRTSAGANLSSVSVDASLAGMEAKSAKFQAVLEGLHLSLDFKRSFDVLYTGPFALSMNSVKWQSLPSSAPGSIKGLSLSGSSSAAGDYYNSSMQLGADAIEASGFSVTHAGYDLSLEHLHGPTLANLVKDQRQAAANMGTTAPADPFAAIEPMKKNGVELLLHEPVIGIGRIGFAMPEGEVRFSAKASVPGLKREDLDGPQVQAALMQHLNVTADLRIDEALALRLMNSTGKKDAMVQQIGALEQQGYLKREGTALTAHVVFAAGKIEVNGKPYPPGR